MKSLRRAGLSMEKLHLTPYMRQVRNQPEIFYPRLMSFQKIYSMTELMPFLPRNIFRGDLLNKVWMQRIAQNWSEWCAMDHEEEI